MTILASEVIDAARDGHQAFSEQRNPNGLLLRQLRKFKPRFFAKVANVNSSTLAVEQVIDITTFNFTTGFAFPAHLYVLPDGEVEPLNEVDRGDRSKFFIIGQNVRLESRPSLSGWFEQGQLFLQGDARDWTGFTNLHVSYVALPTGPTDLGDNFDPMPDSARDVWETYTALRMAKRGHKDETLPPIILSEFNNDFTDAFGGFLQEQGLLKKARRIKTIDRWP